jgi:hypothetical protein
VDITGATGPSYSVFAATTADAGAYTVVATNSCGSLTSNPGSVTVGTAASITTQPVSQSVAAGSPVTFTVAATGATSYQWRKDSGNLLGANGTSYFIAAASPSDAGTYDCIALSSCGDDYSNAATLTVTAGSPCYANCDSSTGVPFLNVQDFSCFLAKFASSDPYANCDGSTAAPALNVADFTCFLGKFAAGCSAP